jgi:hypothetical protein
MTYPGFDPVSEARFRATIEVELRHVQGQIGLLWDHHGKRREEIKAVSKDLVRRIEVLDRKASAEIEAIKSRINGAVYAVAAAALAALWILIKPRLGF